MATEEDFVSENVVVAYDNSISQKDDAEKDGRTMSDVVVSDDSRVSNEDDARVKNVVESPVSKEKENAETKAELNNVVVASDNNEKEDEMMKKVVASKDEDNEKETGMIKSVAVASDHNTVSQEDVEKDAGIKNVVVGSDHNTISQEDVEKDAGIKNVVVGPDHNAVSQEDVENDTGIFKIVDVASDDTAMSKEEGVETETTINNVGVFDNSGTIEKEVKDDGAMKKAVASEDEDNEKGTETDLGIAMEKLNLGPKTDVVKGKVENVEIFGLRRSQRVRKLPSKFKDYRMF